MRFAEVAVQLPVPGMYHYAVPERLRSGSLVGRRVLVPFGRRAVTGVVVATTDEAPGEAMRMRSIDDVIDGDRQLTDEMLELCRWIADYYEAPPGEVLKAALPVGTRVTAKERCVLTDAGRAALGGGGGALPRAHRELLARLEAAGGQAPIRALRRDKIARVTLDAAIEAGLVSAERLADPPRVQSRTERVAVLGDLDREACSRISRAPRQQEVIAALEEAGGRLAVAALRERIPRAADHVRALARAGLISVIEEPIDPGAARVAALPAAARPPELTDTQRAAVSAIESALAAGSFQAFLLHGVTGSGKTEVYLHAIATAVAAGRTALVLVPEISLTPQLAARFRARFGDQVAVLHSGLGDRERYDEWQRLRRGEARIALGARSAVYAPVSDLGIVVVDEEHDSSFKQEEGVRYNARDVALVRAQRSGAVCVLGSATPSLESARAAREGRYRLLAMPDRATPRPLPRVEVIDLRTYLPESDAMLTAPLAEALAETLAAGEQAILFLNRRGFDTFVLCRSCGEAQRCTQCSVSLTYHRSTDRLLCHYCGYWRRVPEICDSCGATGAVVRRGLGTEKVAEAVAERFPQARVARLDRDVAAGGKAEAILARMARREVDILVGTQMVTKGHDFPGVTLVGVLCADTGLSLPDFRAAEKTFQLLTQVAGRAGRGDRPGRVLIQSYRGDTVAVAAAAAQDYQAFYEAEARSREELCYPPFGHLVAIRIDGPSPAQVEAEARRLAQRAAKLGRRGVAVLGPAEAPLARLKGRSRWHLWLRARERKPLRQFVRALCGKDPGSSAVRVTVDVDPVSAL